jgi:esterase/lipase superfamily enzyme
MNVEHHRWWSPSLGQDMELKVYGYFGKPVLVFPAQGGRFFEYEDFHMVDAIAHFIESGRVKVFAVDSVDNQSWANFDAHPADRARRHEAYDRYVAGEVAPFIAQHCGGVGQGVIATGCSMGGYHAANVFFRHPDVFDAMISLSGLFQLGSFIGDYMDEAVYLNTPLAFLPGLTDLWYLDRYRRSAIIVGVGQGAWEEPMLEDARALRHALEAKGVPCWIDVWGADVDHDWPWWRRMMPYFLDSLHLPPYTP